MIKRNKKLMLVTTLVTLLPLLWGLILWNRLPDQIPMHWNFKGEIDGWSGKAMGVLFIPLFLTGAHWFVAVMMSIDPKSQNITKKPLVLTLWIMPVLSVVLSFVTYIAALGYAVDVNRVMGMVLGLLFIILGNYLPKVKPNYTMGIKLPWTLDNEENWRKTHRFGGITMALGGVALLISSVLGGFAIALAVAMVLFMSAIPYSYFIYRKQKKEE